jgi:cytochrome c biogenesis protein CcdA/glutaredoxin
MFYGQGCPHCGKLETFLDEIKNDYPNLKVEKHEVYRDNENRELFIDLLAAYGKTMEGVPTVFVGDQVIVGFSNALGETIKQEIDACLSSSCFNPVDLLNKNINSEIENGVKVTEETDKTANLIIDKKEVNFAEKNDEENNRIEREDVDKDGDVLVDKQIEKQNKVLAREKVVEKLTVPIVISAAFVDAINPCAFAVLIILMTAALSLTDKKKALKFGLAFTLSIYISYFLLGIGLFSALQASGLSHSFYVFVTILAVIVGLLNIKDYFWYGKGLLMEVPLSWRPAMKKILRSATTPFGAFLIGFVVSIFELPCTGGPYIVILGLLAKEVTRSIGIFYLLLYNLIFVSPLIILSFVIYKGLSTTSQLESIRQKKLRLLHLIAGILMLFIATIMIISLLKGWV